MYFTEEEGRHILILEFENSITTKLIEIQSTKSESDYIPIKKQVKIRGSIDEITCKLNFQLIFKATDNSPACVRSATAKILVERGWAN